MAGIPVPLHDVLHQYSGQSRALHKRVLERRQGRDPLSVPDAGSSSSPTDDANTTPSLSLGRPSETATLDDGGDDDQETSTSESTTTSRTRTSSTSTSTTSTTSDDPDTSTTESTSTSETSSSISIITTTVESTSTSTSFSSIESTTEPTTTLPETTSSSDTTSLPTTTRALVTSIVTAAASSLSRTSSNSLASAASDNSSSSGPSAGTVVGIVAGALVGVVVLSGIVGYVFRTKCSNKNDEDDFDGENPFGQIDGAAPFGAAGHGRGLSTSRSEMRRDSQLLADEGDSIHQMSELGHGYSSSNAAPIAAAAAAMGAGAGAYALHRGNSTANSQGGASLPGLQRNDTMNPRPPTMIQRHYANQAYAQQQQQQQMHQMHQQQMPSFQPGQIVYPNMSSNQSGPYPTFQPSPGNVQVGGVFPASTGSDLNRNQSYREQQQQYPSNAVVGNDYGGYGTSQDGHNNNNGYGSQQDHLNNDNVPQRSGTPEYANPQQYFHQASDSFSSSAGIGGGGGVQSPFDDGNASPARNYGHPLNSNQQQQYTGYNNNNTGYNGNGNEGMETLYPQQQQQSHGRDGNVRGAERAKRTLSVRNGGAVLDDDAPRDSVYGGM